MPPEYSNGHVTSEVIEIALFGNDTDQVSIHVPGAQSEAHDDDHELSEVIGVAFYNSDEGKITRQPNHSAWPDLQPDQ